MVDENKKTDWRVSESVSNSKLASAGELIAAKNEKQPGQPVAPIKKSETLKRMIGDSPEGVVAKFQSKSLSRKATVAALKARYESELDALEHRLSKACQVEKARADVIADQYLKELDAQHLTVLSELGLRNKETRERALLKLTDSTVEKLKEVQEKDWPPSLVEQTISEIFELRKRAVSEIMNELASE